MPYLFSAASQGAYSWQGQTVFPSYTLVAHTSMLSGVRPDKHKILWNDWVPSRGLVTIPTVFSVAKKYDPACITALFAAKEKFAHMYLPGSLDAFSVVDAPSRIVSAQAAAYIKSERPNLCFIHFADADNAGHKQGWGSAEQMRAFADEDAALKTIFEAIKGAGIENESVVILTADHGGHDKTHGTDSPEDLTIPWIVWGKGVKQNFEIRTPIRVFDTASTALWLLGVPIPSVWDGTPVKNAFED